MQTLPVAAAAVAASVSRKGTGGHSSGQKDPGGVRTGDTEL